MEIKESRKRLRLFLLFYFGQPKNDGINLAMHLFKIIPVLFTSKYG
jgi:hypothetical protein